VCRERYEEGDDLPTIAKAVRKPEDAVRQWLRRQFGAMRMTPRSGDPLADTFKPFGPEETEALLDRSLRGTSIHQLAADTGRSTEFMACWLRRARMADPYDYSGRAAPEEWGCDAGTPRHESRMSWEHCTRKLLERLGAMHQNRQAARRA